MYRFSIRGVVQGVGFRPYIYNACRKHNITGYVQNIGTGVIAVVDKRDEFISILQNIPPLARIDTYSVKETAGNYTDFSIKQSEGEGFAEVPPDLFLCTDCLRELRDQKNRRHNYFFITCTNCGPRFSMTKRSPYDRHTTAMHEFPMCKSCEAEYTQPEDRRYHAQTIACHKCGPMLTLTSGDLFVTGTDDTAVAHAADLLSRGKVVAIKGVGGFHLATTLDSSAVSELRKLTGRQHKPYAIICRDLTMVKTIAEVNKREATLLESVQRPIVVLRKRDTSAMGDVSELDTVGIMLPYTALHYLLFDHIGEPLVMTSSNRSDEPISTRRAQQLSPHILDHSRRIENPVDDSVIKVIADKPMFLRRSRGYVPTSIPLEGTGQLLALGAEMHNTFCVYNEGKAILSQYMGTTSNATTFDHYKAMVKKFLTFTSTKPQKIIADLHPQYNTSLYAEELAKDMGIPLVRLQHHRAHAYSVAAEHNLKKFAAIVCDGLGYGDDGSIWGGEVFDNDKRIGHLEPQLQLGGDSATKHPAKMLYSVLSRAVGTEKAQKHMKNHFTQKELALLAKQLDQRFNCPETTSTGRIFDAAAVMLGYCKERTYEGRPAMLLEAHSSEAYALKPVIKDNILLTTPLFTWLAENLDKAKGKAKTEHKARLAATVQQYIAEGLYAIAARCNKPIVFSGGCAYSRVMTRFLLEQGEQEGAGKGVYINEAVPAGDGGISFGQIVYALRQEKD